MSGRRLSKFVAAIAYIALGLAAVDSCGKRMSELETCLGCATARRVDEAIVSLKLLRNPRGEEEFLACELAPRPPSSATAYKKDRAS